MTKPLQTIGLTVALTLTIGAVATRAQEKPARREIVPVKVLVVISRYQGERRVSNLPYTLSVNANDERGSSLRMGAQVPIVTTSFSPAGDGKPAPLQSYQYKDVGTNIDCSATTIDDGRFRLQITIDDNSVIAEAADPSPAFAKGVTSFRSFRTSESLLLKDGQSMQFTTATDKVTGDVVKVDVTLTMIK